MITIKQRMFVNKEALINKIIDDLKSNQFECKEFFYDLIRESLRTRSQKYLKEMYNV